MQALELFANYVMPYVPGCDVANANQAIISAAIEFCKTTSVIQDINTYDIIAAESDYDLDIPQQQTLNQVLAAWYITTPLEIAATNSVDQAMPLRGAVDTQTPESNSPYVAYFKTPTEQETLSLYPVPDRAVTLGLTVRASYVPARNATSLDDNLLEDYPEVIASGALARLMAIPNQAYSNQNAALQHKKYFYQCMNDARVDFYRGRTAANMRVKGRRFG